MKHLNEMWESNLDFMTATILNLRDYQSKKAAKPETLEQQAVSIINVALADHLDDTAPCELNPQEPA